MSINSFNNRIGRRDILKSIGAMSVVPALTIPVQQVFAAPLKELAIYGPPAGPSITIAHGVATGAFSGIADTASFTAWRNPDEVRAGLTSGTMQVVVMPVQAAANMYNRGLGMRLVNTLTNGLLYVISTDPTLTSFDALRGKKIAVPFRNDTPDIILHRLLREQGIDANADLSLDTTGTPVEAIQLLLSGKIDAALVPEPAASAAIVRGGKSGVKVHRVIDVQKEWGKVTGLGPIVPQAGLAVTEKFLAENGDLVGALHDALVGVTADVNASPAVAAKNAGPALNMPPPVIAKAIASSNLAAVKATVARPAVEAMLTAMSDADPAIIGGKLPDDGFYAL